MPQLTGTNLLFLKNFDPFGIWNKQSQQQHNLKICVVDTFLKKFNILTINIRILQQTIFKINKIMDLNIKIT